MDNQKIMIKTIMVVHDAIKEAGDQGIVSGNLYAMLMGLGCSLDQYNMIIDVLKKADKITETNFVLKSKG